MIHVSTQTINQEEPTEYKADAVILAVPPRLITSKIDFNPKLPNEQALIMSSTPIWMAGASKVFFEYKIPFWRRRQYKSLPLNFKNGMMLYDASQDSIGIYALCIFLAGKPYKVNEKYIEIK